MSFEKPIGGSDRLQLWAGLECTINRIDDRYQDQFEVCGHHARSDDLDLIASLGIAKLRYPVLWEKVSPTLDAAPNWEASDAGLQRLRDLGVDPIVGLVHHGSGPAHTNLLDPEFGEKLAVHARAVAERYPWVQFFTPVNEPLTTGRFSALYGFWYPHHRDYRSFLLTVIHQTRATVLAMRAIREVNPDAKLVQTEDMGKTHGTVRLQKQVAYENERRWLSLDLLMGRIWPDHPMHREFLSVGISDGELAWFRENALRPDILGINHYLTSERWLDEQLELYPPSTHGGNGRIEYTDVEAVRVARGTDGPKTILREAWDRYGLPMAVTEAHLGCSREEQMRWLVEVWQSAEALRTEGIDLRAVTIWSVLGAYDWVSLLTRWDGHYEPGAFDLRAPEPRATALAWIARSLAEDKVPTHPVLEVPGWWRRPTRQLYPEPVVEAVSASSLPAPLWIFGSDSPLGAALAKECELRRLPYRSIASASRLSDWDEAHPWAILVADAEAWANLEFPLPEWRGKLLLFSSASVFDGRGPTAKTESDLPIPCSAVGKRLAACEQEVLERFDSALIVRSGRRFGAEGFGSDAGWKFLVGLSAGMQVQAREDLIDSPTYIPDMVHSAIDLFLDDEAGIWHLSPRTAVSQAEFARMVARELGRDEALVRCVSSGSICEMNALSSERGWPMPPLSNAISRYVESFARQTSNRARLL